jgi:hypothetical protein
MLFTASAARYAPLYTGRFSIQGCVLGFVIGAIATGCLGWGTRGELKKDGDAKRAWQIIMGACVFGLMVGLPVMFGFAFR